MDVLFRWVNYPYVCIRMIYIYIHTYIHIYIYIYISYPYMINIEILRNTIWHSIPFKWFNMYLWNATSKTWSVFRARGYCIPRSERSSIILKVSWSILAGETYGHLPWSDMLKYWLWCGRIRCDGHQFDPRNTDCAGCIEWDLLSPRPSL